MNTTIFPFADFEQFDNEQLFKRIAACLCLMLALLSDATAQQAKPQDTPDDVIRVSTQLVQTSVSVTDKKGHFVPTLSQDDFEVRVDNLLQPVSFFELVAVDSQRDQSKGREQKQEQQPGVPRKELSPQGRNVFVYIDDLHLAPESVTRTRRMLLIFIDQMAAKDRALIASASGQIGFLQQLTSDKAILRAAVNRLNYRSTPLFDTEQPRMTVEQALAIEQEDVGVMNPYVAFLLRDVFSGLAKTNPAAAETSARQMVHSRARRIVLQSESVMTFTLSGLENLMRSSLELPGRKLGFFVSDGFSADVRNSNALERLQSITDAAVRAGMVVYSLQASGLTSDFPDASIDGRFITGTGTTRTPLGTETSRQTPLAAVATGTGGRALFNMNDLNRGISQALEETSQYYRLAWRPDLETVKDKKFHQIKISIKGRPELTVRVQQGFFSDNASRIETGSRALQNPSTFPIDELVTAIRDSFSSTPLPTYLTVNYVDEPNKGQQLTILMQVVAEDSSNGADKNPEPEVVDVGGAVYDEKGKLAGSFLKRLNVNRETRETSANQRQEIVYLDQVSVNPGLYQVRVAARHSRTGNIGKAIQWIDVPDLSSGRLALGSLLLGERTKRDQAARNGSENLEKARLKIDNRFTRQSQLRLLTYVYNGSHTVKGKTEVELEVQLQILRGDRTPMTSFVRELNAKGIEDLQRIPLAEELRLAALEPGSYFLRVSVHDQITGKSAERLIYFEVE